MTRIRFEDLPSTNTPRNAENLNKLNNVVISSTEPTTGEEVWVQKSKNLFNKNDVVNGYRLDASGELYADSPYSTSGFIAVNPNTSYYRNRTIASREPVCLYNASKNFISRLTDASNVFTTTSETYYIRTSVATSTVDTTQIEEGTTGTSYEPFTIKKIYDKNNNDNYDLLTETVHVGTEEGASSVNFIKSKNLFKGSGISSQSTYICPCKAGDVFTLSFTGSTTSSDVRLFLRTYNGNFTTSLDSYVDNQVINLSSTSNNYSKTITSTTDGFVYIRTAASYINYTLNNIQLEKGSTATSYEPYVTPAIVVDGEEIYNKNNQEIYSTEETRIGTWIDGKPLYRKTITTTMSASTTTTTDLSEFDISSTDTIIIDVGNSTAHYSINTIGGGYAPVVYYVSNTDRAHCYINAEKRLVIQNQNNNQRVYNITLKYTKTTD